MRSGRSWFFLLLAMAATGAVKASEALPFKLSSRSVQGEIQRFRYESKDHLAYELILENFHPKALRFTSLRIQLTRDGKSV